MNEKPIQRPDPRQVTYSNEHWSLLGQFRQKAQDLIYVLEQRHIQAIVHGSIARGDITKDSDIDVFLPNPPSSFLLETVLEQANVPIISRCVIQATPAYSMKAYLELDPSTTISFPLMAMRRREREFFRFSGEVTLNQLKAGVRVLGVDKRLILIEPSKGGHTETSIVGQEDYAAKLLGVAVETVMDRVHALTKRDVVGRTGVFIKRELAPEETFELVLKRFEDENPAVRRRLKSAQ